MPNIGSLSLRPSTNVCPKSLHIVKACVVLNHAIRCLAMCLGMCPSRSSSFGLKSMILLTSPVGDLLLKSGSIATRERGCRVHENLLPPTKHSETSSGVGRTVVKEEAVTVDVGVTGALGWAELQDVLSSGLGLRERFRGYSVDPSAIFVSKFTLFCALKSPRNVPCLCQTREHLHPAQVDHQLWRKTECNRTGRDRNMATECISIVKLESVVRI